VIDIHTHVLPELDDGAESLEQAMHMLRLAAASGCTDLVATPHANVRYTHDPAKARQRIAELRAAGGSDAPRLHLGCELHLTFDNVLACLRSPRDYTIAGGSYLLLELPEDKLPEAAIEIIGNLVSAALRPVIAHPERTPSIRERPDLPRRLAELGCLFQITAGSLEGQFGRRAEAAARALLKSGLGSVVASDGHDHQYRRPSMKAAFDIIARDYGRARAQALCCDNPRAVIGDRDLPEPVQDAAPRSLLQRWLPFSRPAATL
jgi:protein-tyrosine phosphatase